MTTNEILELVRAGYTKQEIESMNGTAEQEQTQEQKAPEQEQKAPEQDQKAPEQEQKTEEVKSNEGTVNKELFEAIKSLQETVKAMQADNARKASGEPPKRDTAESAIMSFFGDVPKK